MYLCLLHVSRNVRSNETVSIDCGKNYHNSQYKKLALMSQTRIQDASIQEEILFQQSKRMSAQVLQANETEETS